LYSCLEVIISCVAHLIDYDYLKHTQKLMEGL